MAEPQAPTPEARNEYGLPFTDGDTSINRTSMDMAKGPIDLDGTAQNELPKPLETKITKGF